MIDVSVEAEETKLPAPIYPDGPHMTTNIQAVPNDAVIDEDLARPGYS